MASKGTVKPQQTDQKVKFDPSLEGKASKKKPHTSLHSYQLTALINKMFTLKP